MRKFASFSTNFVRNESDDFTLKQGFLEFSNCPNEMNGNACEYIIEKTRNGYK